MAPAVVIHGLADARVALGPGAPVTLLSAPGAALYAGCGFWRAIIERARAEFPAARMQDLLDCGDGSGQALAALRIGLARLVLVREAPGWSAIAAIVAVQNGLLLDRRPPALDLARPGALRRLGSWLGASDDSDPCLG